MKPSLRDRNRQIPNGLTFYQPETGWRPGRYQSFQSIVQQIYTHRQGNPHLAAQNNWRMDMQGIEEELDDFNARICVANGWNDYVLSLEGGGLPPKPIALSPNDQKQISVAAGLAKKIWSGVKTINDWIESGDAPVPKVKAEFRAAICANCPQNGQGDFTSWFTKPAAGAIQKQLEKLAERKLSTSLDNQINICEVCLCPLKLKVHTPIQYIKAHLSDAVFTDLKRVPHCWIIEELSKE